LSGETGGFKSLICPTAKAEYFLLRGWTAFADLPVGSICRACYLRIVIAGEATQSIAPRIEQRLILLPISVNFDRHELDQ